MDPSSPTGSNRRGRPAVWERGRWGRFVGGLVDYGRTAWWGIFGPRLTEKVPLQLVQAVVLRDREGGEILLSLRSDLFGWELPGGTVEGAEPLEQALCREVLEETGLVVEVERRVGTWIRTGFRPHRVVVFRCRAIGGTPRPSSETPRVGWTRLDALPAELFPWYRAPIEAALAGGEPAEHREVHGFSMVWAAARIDLGLRWRGLPSVQPPECSSDASSGE